VGLEGDVALTMVVIEPAESFASALERQHHEKPSAHRRRKVLAVRDKAKRRERTAD
jgi:ribosomal protein S21